MFTQWKAALTRSTSGLAGDALGALALFALLVVGLSFGNPV